MIRIQFEITVAKGVLTVFVENPHHFLSVEQARNFIQHNKKWLKNARIVEETIKVLE